MRNKNGFSLIELLVTIIIIAFLLALLIPGYITIYTSVKRSSYDSKVKQIEDNALKYGNTIKDEVKSANESGKPKGCKDINVEKLIKIGYMTSEEEGRNIIKNPTTGAALSGIIRLCYCNNKYDINANYAEEYNPNTYYHKGEKVVYNNRVYECVADAAPGKMGQAYSTTTTTTNAYTTTRLGETTWPSTSLVAENIPDNYFRLADCQNN